MSRLLVGLPNLVGKLDNYAKRYDLLEVNPDDPGLASGKKLAAWRERCRRAAFTVVLPRAVAKLAPGKELEAGLSTALEIATVLRARAILLSTSAEVRPTARNKQRIVELFQRLPEGHHLFWEAHGIWEPAEHLGTAVEAGAVAVFDAAQAPLAPGPVVYSRIRALGHAAQLGSERILHIAEQLRGRREAYLVVDPSIAGKVRSGVAAALERDPERRHVPQLFKPELDLSGSFDDEEQ
ncbi:MAG: DUF72 domain-containing protein [Polyangiaceae bacterium]